MSIVTGWPRISPTMHIIIFCCLLLTHGVVNGQPVSIGNSEPLSVNITARVPPPEIPLETEQIELNRVGNPYTIIPLSKGVQGRGSHSFRIKGGFQDDKSKKLVPAILKRVFDKEWKDNPNSNTVKEIGFLDRPSVGLHLFSKWSKRTTNTTNDPPYQIDIVVKDITTEDPPFKPFIDWYLENKEIRAIDGLQNTVRNIKERLMWYAKSENLVYHDFTMLNIFVRKQATTSGPIDSNIAVMPVDWGLPDDDIYSAGVVDISALDQRKKAAQIQDYNKELDRLDDQFNTEMLAVILKTRNQELRSDDIKKVAIKGRTYELLHFKKANSYAGLYAVVGNYKTEKNGRMTDVPAFMYVINLRRNNGKSTVKQAKEIGLFLDSAEVGDELFIVCRNTSDS